MTTTSTNLNISELNNDNNQSPNTAHCLQQDGQVNATTTANGPQRLSFWNALMRAFSGVTF